jgi:hypothetical protein
LNLKWCEAEPLEDENVKAAAPEDQGDDDEWGKYIQFSGDDKVIKLDQMTHAEEMMLESGRPYSYVSKPNLKRKSNEETDSILRKRTLRLGSFASSEAFASPRRGLPDEMEKSGSHVAGDALGCSVQPGGLDACENRDETVACNHVFSCEDLRGLENTT